VGVGFSATEGKDTTEKLSLGEEGQKGQVLRRFCPMKKTEHTNWVVRIGAKERRESNTSQRPAQTSAEPVFGGDEAFRAPEVGRGLG